VAGLKVWRLSKLRYAEAAWTGEGARLLGGRWNPPGIPLVYTSLSLSLAVLEVLVHLPARTQPEDWVSVSAELDASEPDADRVDVSLLPHDWRRVDHPALQRIGEEWVRSRRSLLLLVPSVIVDGELNALVNPTHPSAASIRIGKPKPFHFDDRLFR
jgi:RES domain-containing protein